MRTISRINETDEEPEVGEPEGSEKAILTEDTARDDSVIETFVHTIASCCKMSTSSVFIHKETGGQFRGHVIRRLLYKNYESAA
jgi:hypothetical protein